MPAGQQVALEPALAGVLGQDLHDPPVDGEVVVVGQGLGVPGAVGDLEDVLQPVGVVLVRARTAGSCPMLRGHHVAQERAEHPGRPRPRRCRARRRRRRSRGSRAAAGRAAAGRRWRAGWRSSAAPPRMPDFRDYAVDVPAPGTGAVEATRVLGTFLRDVMAENMTTLPRLQPGREQLQPARRRPRGHRPGLDGRAAARRRPPGAGRPGHGDPVRAHLPGLAGGLPADRPARVLLLLRGVHPRRRLDVQPARQVAEDHERHPVAAADRLAELPAHLARLAAGPQRLLPPGPGLHRPRRQQEGRRRPGLPAAGRQHAAVGGRPLPAQPAVRQRDRRRQAAGAAVPRHGRRRRALHQGHRHLGRGPAPTPASSPTSSWLRRRRARRWRPWPRSRSCAAGSRTCGSGWSTSST